jgi:rhamnosyltransferase
LIKLAACVVLYNPDDTIFENILTYGNFVDKLIVVDNSLKKNNLLIDKLNEVFESKLIYINNNDNLGIATALNQACDKAIELKFKWILTMDQDSSFINFEHYKKCLEKVQNVNNVALLAANTDKEGYSNFDKNGCSCNYREDKFSVITSANIVNLEYFEEIGRFNDKLFIDMVDYDYCLRINIKKLKILYFPDVFVEHKLGEVHLRTNIFTRKKM